ncbi:trehalose phosphorylase [Schizopora paradoxa]|uniref:Trehalose phosphorylase n=1 Tax=Schizopora paradoxa TaxID=27342 RepID=A0A0H2SNW3_9AGAM|nr:trehalose phosphorylase [Schizopora paradoxa]
MSVDAKPKEEFQSVSSDAARRRLSSVSGEKPVVLASLTPMWVGIAGQPIQGEDAFEVAISIHDSVYNTDYASWKIPYKKGSDGSAVENHVIDMIKKFSQEHMCKFLGAGVTLSLLKETPNLCTRLWLETDVVPIVFNIKPYETQSATRPYIKHRISATPSMLSSALTSGQETPMLTAPASLNLNPNNLVPTVTGKLPLTRSTIEQADSAARKCLMYFGPNNNPRLTIGPMNQVTVDCGGKIHLLDDLEEFKKTVGEGTWNAVIKLSDELREKKIKIGFFSSTPQGGGVALMRHALIRFLNLLDVNAAWYVPTADPAVFRTTKNNHNILQGVAAPTLRLTEDQKKAFDAWIYKNGVRWVSEGGPLAPGGVDIAFIDDPQMPGLIPLIKKVRPDLPIIYRSHIEIRSDLTSIKGSPQAGVWEYLWNNIKLADLFISHPVAKFVPKDVPIEKVALLGAATDFLDGLNKELAPWDSQFYMGEFRSLCLKDKMNELAWPARDYIVQIARFDPSKGIPNVIDSYVKLRKLLKGKMADEKTPQLLICGHGAVDDPDASIIYDQVIQLMNSGEAKEFSKDIVAMRLPPSDQLLNALMQNSKIALQLSTREGFEVKVSEALHTGKPIVASRTGGIPLQVQHGKSGYLVECGDNATVAKHLYDLLMDDVLYKNMSEFAHTHVSDEVGTVGNAAAWLYLAVKCAARGEKLKPNGAWLNDLLREETGEPYAEGETKLPRGGLDLKA